ncbi:hypothetical protein Gotri_005293, partial [Gossypium trilobum]|nr:hypothetical protein [Gossypium trilobum]
MPRANLNVLPSQPRFLSIARMIVTLDLKVMDILKTKKEEVVDDFLNNVYQFNNHLFPIKKLNRYYF